MISKLQGTSAGDSMDECSMTSLLMHFMMMCVNAMEQWLLRQDTKDFLGTRAMVVALRHIGMTAVLREMLKMAVIKHLVYQETKQIQRGRPETAEQQKI